MVMCSNCHKRVAVIFVTKYENEKKVSKGLCIKCAKELNIPMMDKIMPNMPDMENMTEEDMENMTNQLAGKTNIIDRIIVEYNGMWKLESLFMNMPIT